MKRSKKGFTLAELLVVVAIIAVLVAIAIPVFSTQLEKAAEATDLANIRAAYAQATVEVLDTGEEADVDTVAMTQKESGWDYVDGVVIAGEDASDLPEVESGDVITVTVDVDGSVDFAKKN